MDTQPDGLSGSYYKRRLRFSGPMGMGSRDRAKAAVVTSASTAHLYLRPFVRQLARASQSRLIWMEFQMRSDLFRLKSTERSFGWRNPPLSGECSRAGLRFNIEEIVPIESEDGSPTEFGGAKLPSLLRPALNDAWSSKLKPAVS